MIMYVLYITALMLIAARVPHGMDTSGRLSEFARLAPARIPVKHGKNTESTSENVTPSEYPGPQLSLNVRVDRPVMADETPTSARR